MSIKFVKLSHPVKMGKVGKPYNWILLNCKKILNQESYAELTLMIAKDCLKGYYFGYGEAILFEDKKDAEYFGMQATFIKSREPEKVTLAQVHTNWKSSYLYNYGLEVKNPNSTYFNTSSV